MRYFYSFEEFQTDINYLAKEIKKYNPDCLVAIARGGLTLSHFLGELLNIRDVFTINSIHYENEKKLDSFIIKNIPDLSNQHKIILLDDISDTGETLNEIINILNKKFPHLNIITATIFYKKNSIIIPDIKIKEAESWITFFWEKN